MLLQLRLLPRFINQDGEILATPEFWLEAIEDAGFVDLNLEIIPPAENHEPRDLSAPAAFTVRLA